MTLIRIGRSPMRTVGGTCVDGSWVDEGADRRWFAVRALQQREHIAEAHLARQGFTAFLPRIQRSAKRGRKIEMRSVPFFPGYLFVRLHLTEDRWRSVNGTLGVQRLVSFGERPAPAPRGLVEHMMARTTGDGVLQLDESFAAGDRVRILGGAFDGLVGTFLASAENDRVVILLGMLAREVAVKAPRTGVTAA